MPPNFDTSTPALIFKPDKFPLHHGTLGIARSLGRAGIPVYAIVEDEFVPAGFSRFLSGRFLWNPSEADAEQLLKGLRVIGEQIGRRSVLYPTSDFAAIFVEENAASLEDLFLFARPPGGLTRSLADKQSLLALCDRAGLRYPRSIIAKSLVDAEAYIETFGLPLVVKIVRPWQRPRPVGLGSTTLVASRAELDKLFRAAAASPALDVMVQEHVPTEAGVDAMFAAYCDKDSSCLVSFTGEKLRSYPAHAGMTSASHSTDDPELMSLAEGFLKHVGFHGIVDLEFRRDLRDQTYKLLDFNPRVGAQFRLYQDVDGNDVVRAMHLDLTGRAVAPQGEARRTVFVVENYEARVFWDYRHTRNMTIRQWLQTLRGEREYAWYARDDFLPFMAMWLRLLFTYARHRLGLSQPAPSRERRMPAFVRRAWHRFG